MNSDGEHRAGLKVFPLINWEQAPKRAAATDLPNTFMPRGHFILGWPFFQHTWGRDATGAPHRDFALRPLFSYRSEPQTDDGLGRQAFLDIIWPLFQWNWKTSTDGTVKRKKFILFPLVLKQQKETTGSDGRYEKRKRHFIFPFYWAGKTEIEEPADAGGEPNKIERSYKFILPFYWRSSGEPIYLPQYSPDGGAYRMYWPFYGHIPSYGAPGFRRSYTFFLWPFFVYSPSLDNPTQKSFNFIWPFFRAQWGGEKEKVREFKFWPIFQYYRKGDNRRHYFLYPFFIWRDGGKDDEIDRQRMFFPFYLSSEYKNAIYKIYFPFTGYYRDENEHARFIVWPFYTRWVNDKEGFKETQVLWHIFRWRTTMKGREPNVLKQLVLFFQYKHRPGKKTWYHPVLFWHGTEIERFDPERQEDYVFKGRYHFPFYFAKRREYESDATSLTRFFWPFFMYKSEPHARGDDYSWRLRSLWIWWQEDWRGMNRNWTPLFSWWDEEHVVNNMAEENPPAENAEGSQIDPPDTSDSAASAHRRSVFGYLYRLEKDKASIRRHFNLGPISYDRVNDRRAFSLFGGWLPITWEKYSEEINPGENN